MKPILAVWPALLFAPVLVLAEQALGYALTPWLCARQGGEWLHLLAAAFTAASALLTVLALRSLGTAAPSEQFLSRVATGVGALSTFVLLALWLPAWMLEPCLG